MTWNTLSQRHENHLLKQEAWYTGTDKRYTETWNTLSHRETWNLLAQTRHMVLPHGQKEKKIYRHHIKETSYTPTQTET